MLSVIYAECRKQAHYAECHYAECRYAECRSALSRGKHCSLFGQFVSAASGGIFAVLRGHLDTLSPCLQRIE